MVDTCLAFGLAIGLVGQVRPDPPVPIWGPSTERDPKYEKQFVFVSEDLRHIVLRFRPKTPSGESAETVVLRAHIKNRVAPDIRAVVSRQTGGAYLYRYTVANRPEALDPIQFFEVFVPAAVEPSPVHRGRWVGGTISGPPAHRQALAEGNPFAGVALWMPYPDSGGGPIAGGMSENDIQMESRFMPGLTLSAAADSSVNLVDWPKIEDAAWPDEVVYQLDPLLRWIWTGRTWLTIGPTFAPDQDPAEIARGFVTSLDLAENGGWLTPSPFISALRGALTRYGGDRSQAPALTRRPGNPFERELAGALRLSLNIEIQD